MEDGINDDSSDSTPLKIQNTPISLTRKLEASTLSIPQVSPRKSSHRNHNSESNNTSHASTSDISYGTESKQTILDQETDPSSFLLDKNQTRTSFNFFENTLLHIGSQFEEENNATMEVVDREYSIPAGVQSPLKTASNRREQGPIEQYLSQTIEEDPWILRSLPGKQ